MNDDYLWDCTGEPDTAVQDLEEVLGTLRYQPRPLELPVAAPPADRRRFFPGLAVAATIALLVLGATLWLRFHRVPVQPRDETANQSNPNRGNGAAEAGSDSAPTPKAPNKLVVVANRNLPRVNGPQKSATSGSALARNLSRHRQALIRQDEMARLEREEASAGKEQLMLALRLTSAKLNAAQRKTQGFPAPGTIRNQHKIG